MEGLIATPDPAPRNADPRRQRVDHALRDLYPRLTLMAHRLLRRRAIDDLEASDLCQEGVMQAVKCLYGIDKARFDELNDDGLRGILWSVAASAMRGRIVDHIRRADHRRRHRHLIAIADETDCSFEAGQDAREALADLMARSSDPCRKVLRAAADCGDVDIGEIMGRTGFSRAYVYRLLHRMAENLTAGGASPGSGAQPAG